MSHASSEVQKRFAVRFHYFRFDRRGDAGDAGWLWKRRPQGAAAIVADVCGDADTRINTFACVDADTESVRRPFGKSLSNGNADSGGQSHTNTHAGWRPDRDDPVIPTVGLPIQKSRTYIPELRNTCETENLALHGKDDDYLVVEDYLEESAWLFSNERAISDIRFAGDIGTIDDILYSLAR